MKKQSPKLINFATATSPVSIVLKSPVTEITFHGSKVLAADFVIQVDGTPKEGMSAIMLFRTTSTSTTSSLHSFEVFGTTITAAITAGNFMCFCHYTNGSWFVWGVGVGAQAGGTIITTDADGHLTIGSGVVTAAMIDSALTAVIAAKALKTYVDSQDTALGVLITALPAAIWDAITGDVLFDSSGAGVIQPNKVLAAMILAGVLVDAHISATAAIALPKLAASTFDTIPKFGSTGKLEPTTTTPTELGVLAGVTPGTAAASKAVVLDAAGKISALDITALTINGVAYIPYGATVTKTGTYVVTLADQALNANVTSADVTFVLPALSATPDGKEYEFIRNGPANDMIINPDGTDMITPKDSSSDIAGLTITGTNYYTKLKKFATFWRQII